MAFLHVQTTGQVEGINEFINNLSGKFLSSICGLTLALCFLFIERSCIGRVTRGCLTLQKKIDRLFTRKLQETLLLKMVSQLDEQSRAFKLFGTDLSGYLKESFRESMEPTFKLLIEAVEKLEVTTEEMKRQKEESSTAMLGNMMEEFQKSLTGSANTEIAKLGSVLNDTSEFAKGMNERFSGFLGHVDKMLESQRDQNAHQTQSMMESVTALISKIGNIFNFSTLGR